MKSSTKLRVMKSSTKLRFMKIDLIIFFIMASTLEPLMIDELLKKILGSISDGGTYKAARLVCKGWLTATGDRVDELSNHLWTLIDMNPHLCWDWHTILQNPNTTWKLMQRVPQQWWNWSYISQNPNITWEFFKENPQYPWSATFLSNANITFDIIKSIDRWNFADNMLWVSTNPNITVRDIEEYPHLKWDWTLLCKNGNLPIEYVWERIRHNSFHNGRICIHPAITIEFINKYIAQYGNTYNINGISQHPNMTE